MNISRIHFPVTTLGFGRRVGIWFQGCSIRCPGCISQDTWEFGRGKTTLEAVCESITSHLGKADGVTISGGEPFDQPAALEGLLRWLRTGSGGLECWSSVVLNENRTTNPLIQKSINPITPSHRFVGDILVFSGYSWESLVPRLTAWEGLIDVLISDPFDATSEQTLALRGSDNQRAHILTALAHKRYGALPTALRDPTARTLDVAFDGEQVWMAGIPAPGDLERLRQKLIEAGFSADTSQAPPILA